jgi:NodT family efflux transporter outer membrane factor (OMF) lipoprotein
LNQWIVPHLTKIEDTVSHMPRIVCMEILFRRRNLLGWGGSFLPSFALSLLVLTQAGCTSAITEWCHNSFKVGPNYQNPGAPVSPQWIDQGHSHVALGKPNLAEWWDVFGDPVLSRLIRQAYAQNLTLREADLVIEQAWMQRNIARTELLPQGQSMTAGYAHGEVSRNNGVFPAGGPAFGTGLAPGAGVSGLSTPSTPIGGASAFGAGAAAAGTTVTGTGALLNSSIGGGGAGGGVPLAPSRFFDNYGTSMNLSWELDFWGLFRRNLEAANANLNQSMHNYDEMVVQFLANVATQYVELRILQKQLALARKNVALQEPLVKKLYQQFKAGIANSKPAYYQFKSNLDNTKALIPPLEISLRAANNALCVLLGMPVRDLLPELGDGTVPDSKDAKERVVHIPRPVEDTLVLDIAGDVLLRRPDVLAMEEQLRIQSAQIGISEAQLFPHIGINGSIGLSADRVASLFNPQSWIGSIGPSMTWNILNYGRLLANVRIQNNRYQQFVLAYQQTILNANEDAENSLVSYLRSLEQSKYLTDSANAAAEVTKYYYDQIAAGYLPPAATSLTYYNQVFTAVAFQVAQQNVAAQAEGNIALDLILLYRALGGGWQIRLKDGGHGPAPEVMSPPVPEGELLPPPRRAPQPGPAEKAARLGPPAAVRP